MEKEALTIWPVQVLAKRDYAFMAYLTDKTPTMLRLIARTALTNGVTQEVRLNCT
jgi:hypothetical protein